MFFIIIKCLDYLKEKYYFIDDIANVAKNVAGEGWF